MPRMKQLNIAIDDEVMDSAKDAANRAGMYLRRWVERAISRAVTAESNEAIRLREPAYAGRKKGTDPDIEAPPKGSRAE